MKKILLIIFGLTIITTSVLFTKADNNKVELIFAEDCRDRESCTEFTEENGMLVRSEDTKKGDEIVIDIVIKNPEKKPINSVTSWVKYDPTVLKALSVKTDDSPFTFPAPNSNKVNEKEGLVQIENAAPGVTITDKEILSSSIIFEVATDQKIASTIEFFNFQKTELGQTGVISATGLLTENILKEEPKKLKIFLNGATSYTPPVDNTTEPIDVTPGTGGPDNNVITENTENPPVSTKITRPSGLKIRSENGQIKLIWNKGNDQRIAGYFVFYSTQSGMYLFRRDVSNSNNAVIDNLENGKKYYFAITAYDSQMNETDFSDEVYATSGQRGSESHPFSDDKLIAGNELVSPGGQTEDVGPSNIFIVIFGMTLAIVVLMKYPFIRSFSLQK